MKHETEILKKKILMGENFLKELKQFVGNNTYLIEWRTSTGCLFQDIQRHHPDEWIKMTPKDVHKLFTSNPREHVIFALIGNCSKSYSRGMIKNIYAKVTSPW